MLLLFGPVTMDVLVVRGIEISDGWSYAEHAVIEGKPKLQFTGAQLREVSLQFRLRRDWGDPEAMLAQLRALAETGGAEVLQRGDGRLIGLFVLTSLSDRPTWAVSSGRPVDIEAAAQLKEYVLEDAPPPAIAVAGSALARRG